MGREEVFAEVMKNGATNREAERFCEIVSDAIAQEREACAKTCEEKHANGNWKYDTRGDCSAAIRERST